MAYRFPASDQFSPPPQYRYRPTIPRNPQETRAVLYPGERPYQTREFAYHSTRGDRYPAFREGSYQAHEALYHPIPRERYYATFLDAPYETVREGSYPPEGPYQSLPVEPYQSPYEQVPYQLQGPSRPSPHLLGNHSIQPPSAPQLQIQRVSDPSHQNLNDILQSDSSFPSFTDRACDSGDEIPNAQQPGPSRPSPHLLDHSSIQPSSAPQLQIQGVSDSSHQSLNDLLQSDNSFPSFIDGVCHSGDEILASPKTQQSEADFEGLNLGIPSSIGDSVEDRVDSTALALVEAAPNPVSRQWGEDGDFKVFLELQKTANRKLDKMGIAWSDFAYDMLMKGQAHDEWKETIEQRIETDKEMMTEQMAEIRRNHEKSQQKMQEKIDLLLERRGADEESDY